MLGCIHDYVYVLYVYGCVHVYLYVRVSICVWLRVTTIRTRLVRLGPNPDSCSLWTRYTGDSKTDPWDNLEICTDSCSEDQTTIRI